MPKDFIPIERTNGASMVHAQTLLDASNQARALYHQLKTILAVMSHNIEADDYTDIEKMYQVPVGKGIVIYETVKSSVESFEGITKSEALKNLIESVG